MIICSLMKKWSDLELTVMLGKRVDRRVLSPDSACREWLEFCRCPRIWHGNSFPRSLQNTFCYNVAFEWPFWRSEKQMSKDQPSYNRPTFKSVNLSEKVQLPSWIGKNWKHPEKQWWVVRVCSLVLKLYISVFNFLSQLSFVKCFMRKKKPQFPHLQNHDNIILHRQEVLWVLRDIT